MHVSGAAVAGLVDAVAAWAKAMNEGDPARAASHAQHLALHGQVLSIHPDFARRLEQRLPGVDGRQALEIMSRFLLCASETASRASQGALRVDAGCQSVEAGV